MVAISNQGCAAIGSAALLGASFSAYQSASTLYELTKDSNPSGIEKEPTSIQRTFTYLLGGKSSSQSSKILRGVAEAALWATSAVVFGALASVTLDPKGEVFPNSLAKHYINIEPKVNEGAKHSFTSGRAFRELLSDYFPSIFSPPPEPEFFNAPFAWLKHNLWEHGVKKNPALSIISVAGALGSIGAYRSQAKQIAALTEALNSPGQSGSLHRTESSGSVKSVDGLVMVSGPNSLSTSPASGTSSVDSASYEKVDPDAGRLNVNGGHSA